MCINSYWHCELIHTRFVNLFLASKGANKRCEFLRFYQKSQIIQIRRLLNIYTNQAFLGHYSIITASQSLVTSCSYWQGPSGLFIGHEQCLLLHHVTEINLLWGRLQLSGVVNPSLWIKLDVQSTCVLEHWGQAGIMRHIAQSFGASPTAEGNSLLKKMV